MGKFYAIKKIRAQNSNSIGRIDIYGEISAVEFWGDEVTPSQFITDLNALGVVSELEIHIFSNGGDPFAALAIYSELKRRKEKKNVYIDGIAASAATLILCAGDTVFMDETSMLMIHNPFQFICFEGLNAADARELADELDKIREPMILAYQKKSKKSREEIIALMDGDTGSGTWLTAEESITNGLADLYTPEAMKPLEAAALVSPGVYNFKGYRIDLSGFDKAVEKTAGIINSKRGGNSMGLFNRKKKTAAKVKPKAEITFVEMVCPSCNGSVNLNPETGEIFAGGEAQQAEPQNTEPKAKAGGTPKALFARRMPGNVRAEIYSVNCPHCGNDFVWDTDASVDGGEGQVVTPAKPLGGDPAQAPKQEPTQSETEPVAEAAEAICPQCNAVVPYDTATAEHGVDDEGTEGYLLTCPECNAEFVEPFAAAAPDVVPVGASAEAQAAYRSGILAERNRQLALDEMAQAAPGLAGMIQAAKKSGASAEAMSRNVIKAMAEGKGGSNGAARFAAALGRDIRTSGVNAVRIPQHAGKPKSIYESAYEKYAAEYNRGRGGKDNGKA